MLFLSIVLLYFVSASNTAPSLSIPTSPNSVYHRSRKLSDASTHSTTAVTYNPLLGPSQKVTPGAFCTKKDRWYIKMIRGIPICERHVIKKDKRKVARMYNLTDSDFADFEFDHLIPLSLGGLLSGY